MKKHNQGVHLGENARGKDNYGILNILVMATMAFLVIGLIFCVSDDVTSGTGNDGSGTDGGIQWSYVTNTLTISPAASPEGGFSSGVMKDYDDKTYENAPWRKSIEKGVKVNLTVAEGVTHIGNHAFWGLIGGSEVSLPDVTSIGSNAFNYGDFTSLSMPKIVSIGNNAFYFCEDIEGTLTIPSSVTYIGNSSFSNCKKLTGTLTIEAECAINNYAFYKCAGFTGLSIPNVTSIGDYAFSECTNLAGDLTIGENVTSIGEMAFWKCSGFTGSLTIGDKVDSIGKCAFGVYWSSETACQFTSLSLGSSLKTIGTYAFAYCSKITGTLSIPGSVETISDSAFVCCSGLTGDLTIPENVTSIGGKAFYQCKGLNGALTIKGACTIGDNAFDSCEKITSLSIDKASSIGSYAFYSCIGIVDTVTIPDTVGSIGSHAFSQCKGITNVVLPSNLETVVEYTFQGCEGLTGLVIPSSVKTIGDYAFKECYKISGNLTVPGNVTSIGKEAFYKCGKDGTGIALTINGNCEIGDEAFSMGGFTSITLAGNITSIGVKAFNQCEGVTSDLTIPSTVKTIGEKAFYKYGKTNGAGDLVIDAECTLGEYSFSLAKFKSVTIKNVTGIGTKAFESAGGGSLVINASCAISEYAFHSSTFTGVSIENVTAIGDFAFYECTGLSGDLTIPASVKTVGVGAFYECDNLDGTLTIYAETIGNSAFRHDKDNKGFKYIIMSNTKTIGQYAFNKNKNFIGDLEIPSTVTTIDMSAFYLCGKTNGAGSLTINAASTCAIFQYAFANSGFTSISLANVTSIGDYAFNECDKLACSLTIPSSVKTIGEKAFYKCSGLTSITLNSGLESIGANAFAGCGELTGTVSFPSSLKTIGNNAFEGTYFQFFEIKYALNSLGTDVFKDMKFINMTEEITISDLTVYNGLVGKSFMFDDGNYYEKLAIELDRQGGSGGPDTYYVYAYHPLEDISEFPTLERYDFFGWYAADGTEIFDKEGHAMLEIWNIEDTTLYANWDGPWLYVTFMNDGSEYDSQYIHYGKCATRPEMPAAKQNYVFLGWTYMGERYDFTEGVRQDMTVTANWQYTGGDEWIVIEGKEGVPVEVNIPANCSFRYVTIDFGDVKITFDALKIKGLFVASVDRIGGLRYDISTELNGQKEFIGEIAVSIKCDRTQGEPNVYYYPESGDKVNMNAVYDAELGMVSFVISHNSVYGVEYVVMDGMIATIIHVTVIFFVICLLVAAVHQILRRWFD